MSWLLWSRALAQLMRPLSLSSYMVKASASGAGVGVGVAVAVEVSVV